MNISDRQLYFAGYFNALFGCGGLAQAEALVQLDGPGFERVLWSLHEAWHDLTERSRLFIPGDGKLSVTTADGQVVPAERLDHWETLEAAWGSHWPGFKTALRRLSPRALDELKGNLTLFRTFCLTAQRAA